MQALKRCIEISREYCLYTTLAYGRIKVIIMQTNAKKITKQTKNRSFVNSRIDKPLQIVCVWHLLLLLPYVQNGNTFNFEVKNSTYNEICVIQ